MPNNNGYYLISKFHELMSLWNVDQIDDNKKSYIFFDIKVYYFESFFPISKPIIYFSVKISSFSITLLCFITWSFF